MKENLYWKALIAVIKNGLENNNYTHDNIKRMAFYGIKYTNTQRVDDMDTLEEAEDFHKFVMAVSEFIGRLTPNEFMNMFPITKEYDGHKWGMKDYFYTMEYINTLERDKSIKAQNIDGGVMGFLWEYHNREVRMFTVKLSASTSNLQKFQVRLSKPNGRTTVLHKPRHLKRIK